MGFSFWKGPSRNGKENFYNANRSIESKGKQNHMNLAFTQTAGKGTTGGKRGHRREWMKDLTTEPATTASKIPLDKKGRKDYSQRTLRKKLGALRGEPSVWRNF